MSKQKLKKTFTSKDFNFGNNPISRLSNLLSKEALKSDEIELNARKNSS